MEITTTYGTKHSEHDVVKHSDTGFVVIELTMSGNRWTIAGAANTGRAYRITGRDVFDSFEQAEDKAIRVLQGQHI